MTYGRAKAQDFEVPPRQTAYTLPSAPLEPERMPAVRSEQALPPGMPELRLL
jgi:hypothetical protein